MKGRPNNISKTLLRSKSPTLQPSKPETTPAKINEKNMVSTQLELHRYSSSDAKSKPVMREEPKSEKKPSDLSKFKQVNLREADLPGRPQKIDKNGKNAKDEDDNTTEQSSSQHISYVAGEYQLDSYDLFAKKKNVQFEQKALELERVEKMRDSIGKTSSRNSSILKNSNRVLDRSLGVSSDKSLSIQNSFTATKKCKIGFLPPENNNVNLTRKKYQGILQQLKSKQRENGEIREKYIDDLFPPVQASLFSTSVYKKNNLNKSKDQIVWLRLSQIFNPRHMRVYSKAKKSQNTITSDKSYSQPYFSTCLNAIKNNSQLLCNIFESEEINQFGIYLVKVYQQNSWRYVIVDDLIPCVKRKNRLKRQQKYIPAFINVTPAQGEMVYVWPFLLEKAYANYYSCYENLCFGNTVDFLSELTGAPYSQLSFVAKRNFKPNVQKNLSIISKHITMESSTVIGWIQSKESFYSLYLIKDSYTSQNISVAYNDPTNHEVVTLQLSQIPTTFSSVYIYSFNEYSNSINCPVYPPKALREKVKKTKDDKLKGKYIQIPQNDTTSVRAFTIFKKTKCCINLRQKQNRFYQQCSVNEYLWVRCLFIQKQYDGGFRWIHGKYTNQKHIIFEELLEPGEYFLVIMVEWREKHNRQLTVVLYSDCDFLKFQRRNYNKDEKIIELSCMDLAQRFGKLSQINKSICAYTYLCEETALIIQNIINQRTKGDVTIMRSINGLKSRVEILPVNSEFEIEIPEEYATLEKGQVRRGIDQSIEIDIKKGESFTVVLRMKGGIDKKFFKVFNFG